MPGKEKVRDRDFRARADLKLFLLALIERGLTTPYDFQASAGLSPGATLPVLGRLEKAGWVRRGKPGVRRRSEYECTAEGRRHLKDESGKLLDEPIPTDIDVIVRISSLALLSGADRKKVSAYLLKAADIKLAEARDRKSSIQEMLAGLAENPPAGAYGWMRAVASSSRLSSEVKVLRELAKQLAKVKLSGPESTPKR